MLSDVEASAQNVLSSSWELMPLAEVEDLVSRIYGIAGTATRLSSERDETFKFSTIEAAYILKIANPAEDPAALAFQDGALLHLEASAPDLPVPRLIPTLQGRHSNRLMLGNGMTRIVRLLSYLDGELLYKAPRSVAQTRNLGTALATMGRGLADLAARPPAEKLLWDISHMLDLADLVCHVGPERQRHVRDVLDAFDRTVPQAAPSLRQQVIHNDLNPYNILVDPASPSEIAGIIDFGDMVFAPLVNDLAVALAYHTAADDWMDHTGALLHGYNAVTPLLPGEIELLPVLTKARLAMTIIITEWRVTDRPDDRDYILRNHPSAWRGLQRLADVPDADFRRFISQTCED